MERDGEHVLLPGEDVTQQIASFAPDPAAKFVLGPGLIRRGKKVLSTTAGRLMSRKDPLVFWIHANQRRYVPINGERVVGVVVSKSGLTARVDIGSNELATLNLLAFESATKKNRPDVKVGDVVYARVVAPVKDAEVELVCITSALKRDGMGLLTAPNGHHSLMVCVPVHTSRKLLSPEDKVLEKLGEKIRFEVAIGMNGRLWFACKSMEGLVFICGAVTQ